MSNTCKIKVVVTLMLEATFEDTLAAANMFKTLEQDANPSTIRGMTGDRWSIHADGPLRVSVTTPHEGSGT
jgi:hypothetical protein